MSIIYVMGHGQGIVEFIEARLAEDEAVALAASRGGWHYGDVDSVAGGTLYDESRRIADVVYEQPSEHDGAIVRHLLATEADANGVHIVRHDPARVLAQVAALRAVVALHEISVKLDRSAWYHLDGGDGPKVEEWDRHQNCAACGVISCHEYMTLAGESHPPDPTTGCATLRHIAAIWSDHADYDEGWKP